MTTGLLLVQDALLQQGVLGENVAPNAAQLATGLRFLNRLIDSISNRAALIFTRGTESLTLGSVAAYSTALLPAGRFLDIDSMTLDRAGISYPCEMITASAYNAIPFKNVRSIPSVCYYDNSFPDGAFNFYPVPIDGVIARPVLRRVLTGPITATTDVLLPPGYEKMIVDKLALYKNNGFEPSAQMREDAKESAGVLERTGFNPDELSTPFDGDGHSISNAFPYRNW